MNELRVHYCGWGEDWPLGTLADDGKRLVFEYSAEALDQRLELSPLHLKLSTQSFGGFPSFLHRLPGLIADSLPDGWGLLLMDRLFRRKGLRHLGPLDRLAFIGDRAMGALRFAPPAPLSTDEPDWTLLALAEESARALAGDADVALQKLALTGGSPQGARPKAQIYIDDTAGRISTRRLPGYTPWLVKFPGQDEHKEVCAIEQLYAELAKDCALDMPESRWFDLAPSLAAFGVARFDRWQDLRVPVHSLAGLLHANFRTPGSVDYTMLLRATRMLTGDEREVQKAFSRCVFNVLFHNRDDHPKNFAWLLGQDRRWRLSPAFDLTFSEGPGGQHHMDICGEGDKVTRAHLLRLAAEGGVEHRYATRKIDDMLEHSADISQRASNHPIRKSTIRRLASRVETNRRRLNEVR